MIGALQQCAEVILAVDHAGDLLQSLVEALGQVVGRGDRLGVIGAVAVKHPDICQGAAIIDINEFSHDFARSMLVHSVTDTLPRRAECYTQPKSGIQVAVNPPSITSSVPVT